MKIRQMLVNANKYNIKCPYTMTAKYIVVHNTANDASANNEIQYMITNNNQVSFHIAVDDVEAVQGIPFNRNTWHAGDGGNGNGNRNGIAIEICYSKSGGERFNKAEINATKLIAQLLKERGWGIDKVKKHQDFNGKYCPHRTLDMGWTRFLNMVQAELNALNKPSTPSTGLPKGVEKYDGFVEITYSGADGIDLHSKPTFSGSVSGNAKKGTVLTVLGRIKVSGVYMYYTKAGHYITSAKEYVSFRTTLHGTASKPQTPPKPSLTPIQKEAASLGMKVADTNSVKKGFWISKHATIYGGASYGVKIPSSILKATTKYSYGGLRFDRGEHWVLANEIMSWVKVSECLVR